MNQSKCMFLSHYAINNSYGPEKSSWGYAPSYRPKGRLTNQFCYGKPKWEMSFCTFGSNFGNDRFFKWRNCQENLVSKEEFRPNKLFKLGQIWHQQRHSCLPTHNVHVNCGPTCLHLQTFYASSTSASQHIKLIIDFRLERF